ncbi:MAG: hypothetical protein RLZZ518_169, partial [Actinomycetota bacterium]
MLIARFALAGGLIVATAACGERMIYEASTDPTVAGTDTTVDTTDPSTETPSTEPA